MELGVLRVVERRDHHRHIRLAVETVTRLYRMVRACIVKVAERSPKSVRVVTYWSLKAGEKLERAG